MSCRVTAVNAVLRVIDTVYTVIKKTPPLFIQLVSRKCWPISIIFDIIIVYWVNWQHTSYWFTHFIHILLLYYLGKQVKCIMITVSPINQSYTLQFSLKQHPVYLYNQSEFKFNCYSDCSKCPPFLFTQAWSLFRHSWIASSHSTVLCDKLCHVLIKRCLWSFSSRTGVWYTRSYIPLIWYS